MGFIPVNLSIADSSTLKANFGVPFEFSPFGVAIRSRIMSLILPLTAIVSICSISPNISKYMPNPAFCSSVCCASVNLCMVVYTIISKMTSVVKIDSQTAES